ncbi:MAG TPA: TolC family protein [Candidatus Binataceae bacterium]|nr:TolC family protein [Candidatus Binataceae bacterium]
METTVRRASGLRAAIAVLTAMTLLSASRAGAQGAVARSHDASSDLASLVREGMERNPDVVAAREHWQALRRAPIQMRTLPDPQLQLQEFTVGSPKPSAGYETSDFYYTGFGAAQDIPGPGKLRLQGEIAEQDAEIARHQYQAAQRQAAEKIREGYFELFYLTKTAALLARERGQLAQIERIAEARYRVGEGLAQDVLKAQLQATRMLDEIERRRREMQQRQADLKAALGRDLDSANIAVGDVEPTRVDLNQAQLAGAVSEHSTDLMMDRAARGRSEKALDLARRAYLPDFTLGYEYEKTGPGLRDYYMLTLGAKIPLYFWRKQTPAIEQAALELSAARSRLRAHELDAAASAEDQLVAIRASDRILKVYDQGLIPQAENSMQAALAAYRVSKADFQTLLSAFVDLLNLRQEYYRELADREIAVARLEQIVGEMK